MEPQKMRGTLKKEGPEKLSHLPHPISTIGNNNVIIKMINTS